MLFESSSHSAGNISISELVEQISFTFYLYIDYLIGFFALFRVDRLSAVWSRPKLNLSTEMILLNISVSTERINSVKCSLKAVMSQGCSFV